MRVVNDRGEAQKSPELGVFAIVAHSLFCALGVSTLLLGPLPILYAHAKMTEPWPKITALAGAILALFFLEVPLVPVLMTFVLGLFLSDAVARKVPLQLVLSSTLSVAMGAGIVGVVAGAYFHQQPVVEYWVSSIDTLIASLRGQMEGSLTQFSAEFDWEALKTMILYEGPFLYLSLVLVSAWLSIGLAAHLGWWTEKHPYAASELRKVLFPKWLSVLFFLFLLGTVVGSPETRVMFSGAYRFVSVLFFLQGTVALSRLFEMRGLRPGLRTTIYSFFVLLGFYLLVGMGVIAPWVFRKFEKIKQGDGLVPNPTLEEAL